MPTCTDAVGDDFSQQESCIILAAVWSSNGHESEVRCFGTYKQTQGHLHGNAARKLRTVGDFQSSSSSSTYTNLLYLVPHLLVMKSAISYISEPSPYVKLTGLSISFINLDVCEGRNTTPSPEIRHLVTVKADLPSERL